MSDDQQLEQFQKLGTLINVGKALIVGAFIMGGWVTTLEMRTSRTVSALEKQTAIVEKNAGKLTEIDLWRAETAGNRFTINDYTRANTVTQEQLTQHDKRLTRTEDSLIRLELALGRVENKLGTRP